MAEITIEVKAYKCDRCGHIWQPHNTSVKSRTCPKCKSPYWDVPRKNKVKKKAIKTKEKS